MDMHTKRIMLDLEPELHDALRPLSIAPERSVSDPIKGTVREGLAEDAADLAIVRRAGKGTHGRIRELRKISLTYKMILNASQATATPQEIETSRLP